MTMCARLVLVLRKWWRDRPVPKSVAYHELVSRASKERDTKR